MWLDWQNFFIKRICEYKLTMDHEEAYKWTWHYTLTQNLNT